jgi:hypothetical protein
MLPFAANMYLHEVFPVLCVPCQLEARNMPILLQGFIVTELIFDSQTAQDV